MSESNADVNVEKMVKSELYHVWKKARMLYDMINVENCPDWAKVNIRQAHDLIDEAMRYEEYSNLFPEKVEEDDESSKNNFLTNEDKRYPTPSASESGDLFVTRCILDANMKKRYPVQADRFSACMLIYSDKSNAPSDHDNPGEKFDDPMNPVQSDIDEPEKPMLP